MLEGEIKNECPIDVEQSLFPSRLIIVHLLFLTSESSVQQYWGLGL